MPEELLLDAILLAIFVNIKRRCPTIRDLVPVRIQISDEGLQEMLLLLKSSVECSVLDSMVFTEGEPVNFSPALTEALGRLQFSGMLARRDTHEPECLILSQEAEDCFTNHVRLTENERNQINLISSKLAGCFLRQSTKLVYFGSFPKP